MSCHDSKLPVSFPEIWSFQRDHARGTTPLAQYYLQEARTYCPPSKAHKRRILLKRDRPAFTKPPAPIQPNLSARCHHNNAAQLGRQVAEIARNAALVERHFIRSNEPVRTPATNLTRPPVTYGKLKEDTWPTMEEIDARIASLKADAERAKG